MNKQAIITSQGVIHSYVHNLPNGQVYMCTHEQYAYLTGDAEWRKELDDKIPPITKLQDNVMANMDFDEFLIFYRFIFHGEDGEGNATEEEVSGSIHISKESDRFYATGGAYFGDPDFWLTTKLVIDRGGFCPPGYHDMSMTMRLKKALEEKGHLDTPFDMGGLLKYPDDHPKAMEDISDVGKTLFKFKESYEVSLDDLIAQVITWVEHVEERWRAAEDYEPSIEDVLSFMQGSY